MANWLVSALPCPAYTSRVPAATAARVGAGRPRAVRPALAAGMAAPPPGAFFGRVALVFRAIGAVATATMVTAAITTKSPVAQTMAIRRSFIARRTRSRKTALPPSAAACWGTRDGLGCIAYGDW